MQELTTVIKVRDARGNTIGEKEVATYAGLLSRAHEEGLSDVTTALVQAPTDANGLTAICFAKVTTVKGTFTGIGDASPENVNKKITPHIIRMAETRAKARALRDAVNIGVVCLEELGGGEGDNEPLVDDDRADRSRDNVRDIRDRPGQGNDNRNDRRGERREEGRHGGGRRVEMMTDNQRRFLLRLLAEDGIEGNEAVDKICASLGVAALPEITKHQASRLIDEWQKERRQGA